MEKEQIIEGDKLIAEFMGWKLITPKMRKSPADWMVSYWEKPDTYEGVKIQRTLCQEGALKYHKSWDWLMPAWIKFRDLEIPEELQNFHSALCDEMGKILRDCEDAYEPYTYLVDCIKWHNQNNK